MTQEEKIKVFELVQKLEVISSRPVYDGRDYFEQVEGAYKVLTELGINKEYIRWEQANKERREWI